MTDATMSACMCVCVCACVCACVCVCVCAFREMATRLMTSGSVAAAERIVASVNEHSSEPIPAITQSPPTTTATRATPAATPPTYGSAPAILSSPLHSVVRVPTASLSLRARTPQQGQSPLGPQAGPATHTQQLSVSPNVSSLFNRKRAASSQLVSPIATQLRGSSVSVQ